MMLSTANLLSPSNGEPVVGPTQDMVLGCYYLTIEREHTQGKAALARFADEQEVLLAYDVGRIDTRRTSALKNHTVPKLSCIRRSRSPSRRGTRRRRDRHQPSARRSAG